MSQRLKKYDRTKGPLQVVHDFKFVALNVKDNYDYLDKLSFDEKYQALCKRVDELYNRNYGGIIVNVDYKNYLSQEEPQVLMAKVVKYAKELGMRVWIYDEQYYPSGSAGGHVLCNHPEYEGICLSLVEKEKHSDVLDAIRIPSPAGCSDVKYAIAVPIIDGKRDFSKRIVLENKKDLAGNFCWNAPAGDWYVMAFFVRVLFEHTHMTQSPRSCRRYPDIMNKEAMERFVEVTFTQGYDKYMGTPLGEMIEAVFTDEPRRLVYEKYQGGYDTPSKTWFPSVSVYDEPNDNDVDMLPYIYWQMQMPDVFKEMYGYDLIENLPEIFFDMDKSDKVRIDYYRMLDKMSKEAYLETLASHLNRQNVALSGHYLYEEEVDWHPHLYGDILKHLGFMDIPGCDLLYSAPDKLRYSLACKMASSAAHIYDKEQVMIEASNMVDKDQSFDLRRMNLAMSMIFSLGVNVVASYYGENILSADDMKSFGEYAARLASVLDGGKCKIDTLLFYPFEELCAVSEPQRTQMVRPSIEMTETNSLLLSNQIQFDIINIDKLEECTFDDGAMTTNYGQTIKNIVLPKLDKITSRTNDIISKAVANGIQVYFAGDRRNIEGLTSKVKFFGEEMVSSGDVTLLESDEFVTLLHKEYDDCDLYFVVNTQDKNKSVTLDISGENLLIMNPIANTITQSTSRGKLTFDIEGFGSIIVCKNK